MRRLYLNARRRAARCADLDPRHLPGCSCTPTSSRWASVSSAGSTPRSCPIRSGLRLVSFESATRQLQRARQRRLVRRRRRRYDALRRERLTRRTSPRRSISSASTRSSRRRDCGRRPRASIGPAADGRLDGTMSAATCAAKRRRAACSTWQPGAGRMVGLLSLSALPRRLALDFRDVFNRGLVFDEINGGLRGDRRQRVHGQPEAHGPGRRDRHDRPHGPARHDYHQQAVVTAEPGNVLPTVGALLGGPGGRGGAPDLHAHLQEAARGASAARRIA